MGGSAQKILPKRAQAAEDCSSLFVLPHSLLLPAWNTHVMAGFSAALLDHEQPGDGSHALLMAEQVDRISFEFYTSRLFFTKKKNNNNVKLTFCLKYSIYSLLVAV